MTLPTNYKLPELIKEQSPEQTSSYLQDLIFELQNMYEETAEHVNGVFRNSDDVDGSAYIPTLEGSVIAGTFQYTHKSSYVLRQGLMSDVWYSVGWTSSGTATGNLCLVLPYKVVKKSNMLWTGSCFLENAIFGAGRTSVVCAATSDSYKLNFESYGSGVTKNIINVYGSGSVTGHIRYIGVADE